MKKIFSFIIVFSIVTCLLNINSVDARVRKKYLFIGDSRFYGIKEFATEEHGYSKVRFNCAGSASTLSFENRDLNNQLPTDMDDLTIYEANDIEKILYDMQILIENMVSQFNYSGELFSGEV